MGPSANYAVRLGGVESQWGVFAPNPRTTSLKLEGRVTFEDGSTAVWHLPEGPRSAGTSATTAGASGSSGCDPTTSATCGSPRASGSRRSTTIRLAGERVQLVRLFHDNPLTGEQPPYDEFVYHTCPTPRGGP